MRERTILLGILSVLGLIALGLVVGSRIQPLPELATDRAQQVNQLLKMLFGLATAVLLAVEGLLIFSAVRGRLGLGSSKMDGSLELLWILLPSVIVIVISVYSIRVLTELESPTGNPLIVEVNASQYRWSFHYAESGVTAGELHLPVGRQVQLRLLSSDVVHSFWVPEFGGKVDAVPGLVTSLTIVPMKTGVYRAVCAEYCGAGHTGMLAPVQVESAAAFDSWLADQ